jgi:predicted AlkP superfamily pyrophosphatase or phosphodiesterase
MRVTCIAEIGSRGFATSILALFVIGILHLPTAEAAGSGGRNAAQLQDSPYLILISIDGFRWDYQAKYETPALDRIAVRGLRAESLQPVYPSLTFPNHFSIATGLYPAEHGIVHNHFPNGRGDAWYHIWDRAAVENGDWYRGEPIWVAAERAGLVSAAYYFVGTEAAVGGVSPTHWRSFDASIPASARVAQVIEWLKLPDPERPHMVTLYFEDVDDAGHDYGQGSAELEKAARLVDTNIGRLLDAIDGMPIAGQVNVVVVSDHGQSWYADPEDTLILDELISLDGLEIVDGGAYASIFVPEPMRAIAIRDAINEHWRHGKAYLRDETPDHWRVTDDERFPDVFVMPDLHHGVLSSADRRHKLKRGDHGWDPRHREMHGIFLATGPGVPAGREIGTIEAVDIYPLLLDLLQIRADDGDYKLRQMLNDDG